MASKDQTAAEIMAAVAVELDWNSLIDDLTSALGSEAGRSARAAIQALQEQGALPAERATLATLFDSVDAAGLKYAQERGAELVGMRVIRDDAGFITSIIQNPNPEWAITETTRERLRELVGKAIDGGWASSKLREEIYHSEDFSNYRASTIARSEIDMAHLEGQHNAALGSEMKSKRWLKADSAVCDDCEEMNGEVVAIDSPFSSGTMTTYLHPHDRCTAEYLPGEPEDYEDDDTEKLAKYNEDQPRDERGRWEAAGAAKDALEDHPARLIDPFSADAQGPGAKSSWASYMRQSAKLYQQIKALADPAKDIEQYAYRLGMGSAGNEIGKFSVKDVLNAASDLINHARETGPTDRAGFIAADRGISLLHSIIEEFGPGSTFHKAYNEDQPRDEKGRWGSGGGEPATSPFTSEMNAKLNDWVLFGPKYAALKDSEDFAATLRSLPQHEGTMYRGTQMTPEELAGYKEGAVYRYEQNSSASARGDDWDEKIAARFAGRPFQEASYGADKTENVVLRMEGARGANLDGSDAYRNFTANREAVIPIGESFHVEKVEPGQKYSLHAIKDGKETKTETIYTRITLRGTHGDGSLGKAAGADEDSLMGRIIEADSGLRPIGLSRLQKYSEDQPRDENGRFSGGDMGVKLSEMSPEKAEAERGRLRAVHARQREARAVARETAKDKEASRQGLLRAQRAYANERTPEALRGKRDEYFGDRPIVMTGEVGNLFASEFRTAYDALPQRVRDTVMGAGVAVVAANQSVAEAVPRLTNEQPRGYEVGRTFKNVDGVFCPSDRVAVVAARTVDGENNRVAGALRHEVGHAYDFAYATHTDQGWATDTPQFKVAYARDLDHIDAHPDFNGFTHAPAGYDPAKDFNSGKAWEPTPARTIAERRIGYYLQRSEHEIRAGEMNGAAGRQEAFAEVFAQLHGTGSTRVDLLQYFPHMTKAIKEYVDTGEIK